MKNVIHIVFYGLLQKNYKVTIILPLITYTVPSNSIKIQQFIDFELLFYLYNINFLLGFLCY